MPATLVGFGNMDASVIDDPNAAGNSIGQLVRPANAEFFAGATMTNCPNNGTARFPFTDTLTSVSIEVWSPAAGLPIRVKVENSTDPGISVETETLSTVANGWETMVFDFANQVDGTAVLNTANVYDKISIFPNFNATGVGDQTYFVDDVTFLGAVFDNECFVAPQPETFPITFDDANTTYTFTGFGGAEDTTRQPDPDDATNFVGRTIKSDTAATFAGAIFSTLPNFAIGTIPLTSTDLELTLRVRSPRAGIPVRLKVEDAADPTRSVETEALTTAVNTWETLTFDMGNPASGTAAWNATYTYNKAVVFFDFGKDGASGGGGTFYFDDLELAP